MPRYFIEPSDVLLFRDGKPFNAGDEHRARTMFPPSPTVVVGAMRSRVLIDNCINLPSFQRDCKDAIGNTCDQYANCQVPLLIGTPSHLIAPQLVGPLIARLESNSGGASEFFSTPFDLVKTESINNQPPEHNILSPVNEQEAQEMGYANYPNSGLRPVWWKTTSTYESAGGFLSSDSMLNYLCNNSAYFNQPQAVVSEKDLFERESRFGIRMENATQTVKTGMLYQAEFARVNPFDVVNGIKLSQTIGLVVECEIPVPDKALLTLGGEARAATYQKLNDTAKLNYAQSKQLIVKAIEQAVSGNGGGFKIVVTTPAFFAQGWLPQFVNPASLENACRNAGLRFRLISAEVARSQPLGGWNIAENSARSMRRPVMPGSIYYFELEDASIARLVVDNFHWKNISDAQGDTDMGFGLALVGAWEYESSANIQQMSQIQTTTPVEPQTI